MGVWECFPLVMPSFVPPDQRLAVVIAQVRGEHGRTQEKLAADAELVATTIGRLERGEMDPAWTTVCAIAEALGMPLVELCRLVEDQGSRS